MDPELAKKLKILAVKKDTQVYKVLDPKNAAGKDMDD